MKRILKFATLYGILGLLTGILASCVPTASFSVYGTGDIVLANWRHLGMPPQKPTKIIAVNQDDFADIIVAHDNEYYRCCPTAIGKWEAIGLPDVNNLQQFLATQQVYRELVSKFPDRDFSIQTTSRSQGAYILNYPPDTIDSVVWVVIGCLGLSESQANWVIRADGAVWMWDSDTKHKTCSESKGNGVWLSHFAWLGGAVIGLVMGAVLAHFGVPTRRKTSKVFSAAVVVAIVTAPTVLLAFTSSNPQHMPIATPVPTATLGAAAPATITTGEVTPAARGTPGAAAHLRIRPGGGVASVAFSPDGRLLAGSVENTVRIWDAKTGVELRSLNSESVRVWGVAFSPDGRLLASANYDDGVGLLDAATGAVTRILSGHTNPVYTVAFSPDGRLLASGDAGGIIRVWDSQSGAEVFVLEGPTSYVDGLAFSPDGRLLASTSFRGIQLWDPATGTQLKLLSTGDVSAVAFSPDGRLLATGGLNQTVQIWDVVSGTELRSLNFHTNVVKSVAFSPDGRLLASSSQDTTVLLWDVETGKRIATLAGHTEIVGGVAFSPDGGTLASASQDMTIVLWDIHQ
jgi:WD40 repeat protein